MKISDSQIRKGIIKEHSNMFLYDNVSTKVDCDSVFVVSAFDKIDCRFIDFHIRYITVCETGYDIIAEHIGQKQEEQ